MSNTNYEDKIIDAIQVIVDSSIQKAGYDKTIQASIIECIDATIGQYKVKYQDSTFFAFSESIDTTYSKGTSVWVLIPSNDMTQNKTILGPVSKLGEDFSLPDEKEDLYDISGVNCVKNNDTFNFCSYETKTLDIYNADTNIDLINLAEEDVTEYFKNAEAILCGATFRTALPAEQRLQGNYGIIFELLFRDNLKSGNTVIKKYIIDINSMNGEVYNFINPTRQYDIFDIDNKTFVKVNKISLFIKGFPHQRLNEPDDIFISNIELYGCRKYTAEELAGNILTFKAPQGTYFDTAATNDAEYRTIQAIVKSKGEVVNPKSQTIDYYWFVENMEIDMSHELYNPLGQEGWKCLNDYEVTGEVDGKKIIDWVSATDTWKVTREAAKAKETTYKCVAVYKGSALSREITITNYGSKFNITIESDLGEQFYYDVGNPTLTCKVNGVERLDYTYKWVEIDPYGQYTPLSDTLKENNDYNKLVEDKQKYEKELEDESALKTSTEKKLEETKQDLKEYEYFTRVEKNKIHKVAVKEITNFKTYKCSVYDSGTFLGTSSIILRNTLGLDNGYTLVLNNGTQVFKYNANGIAPTSNTLENPYIIPQLSFTIYDGYGNPLSDDVVQYMDITWEVPNNMDSMLTGITNDEYKTDTKYKYILDEETGKETIKQALLINYGIRENYYLSRVDNVIKLSIDYNGLPLHAETSLTFVKEGEPGTNGTEFGCRIIPNAVSGSQLPLYPTLTILNTGVKEFNFTKASNAFDKWFKLDFWHNGNSIFTGTEDGNSKEGKKVEKITWSILKNKYNTNVSDPSNLSIKTVKINDKDIFDGFVYNECGSDDHVANIIQCNFEYDKVDYYTTLPLIIVKLRDDTYRVKLKDLTGFRFATYTSDGRNPSYDDEKPFELIVTKLIDGVEEDISTTETSYKVTYDWEPRGQVYEFKTEKFQKQNLILETTDKGTVETLQPNQKRYKPADDFSGECVTNAIRCIIKHLNNPVAEIYIPIHLMLNRYGHAGLNDWNGNSIDINTEGGYILTPQIGAGKKNDDNSFTGMLMGVVKEPNRTTADNGLLAYHKGVRTVFIDSETGAAIFGRKTAFKDNADAAKLGGQIIIDPSSNAALIYSSKFWKSYKENGLPIGYGTGNQRGEEIPDESSEKHFEYSEKEYGMLINLDEPEIRWGNKNFIVNKYGHLTARGGGIIAGWKINDYRIDSTDTGESDKNIGKTGISSVYDLKNTHGVIKWDVKVPKLLSDAGKDGTAAKAIAFWAGGNTENAKFYVSHDGYLRTQEATIGSGSTAELIYIGKSIRKTPAKQHINGNYKYINTEKIDNTWTETTYSSIYSFKKTHLWADEKGFYLGTDGIAIGALKDYGPVQGFNYKDMHSRFEVDAEGNLYAEDGIFRGKVYSDTGEIGGWIIDGDRLYAKDSDGKTYIALNASNTRNSKYAFWTGDSDPTKAAFAIRKDGTLEGTGVSLEGSMMISSGNIKMGDFFNVSPTESKFTAAEKLLPKYDTKEERDKHPFLFAKRAEFTDGCLFKDGTIKTSTLENVDIASTSNTFNGTSTTHSKFKGYIHKGSQLGDLEISTDVNYQIKAGTEKYTFSNSGTTRINEIPRVFSGRNAPSSTTGKDGDIYVQYE